MQGDVKSQEFTAGTVWAPKDDVIVIYVYSFCTSYFQNDRLM